MSRCVLSKCYHCLRKNVIPTNKTITEKLYRQVRTGQFLRIPPCESTALLSVRHQDQFTTKAAANKSLFLITQTQHRKMSDIAEKSIAPSVGSRWMEKVKAFLTKTDNPTKLPIRHLQAAGSILILSISDYVSYEELLHICNLDDTFYSFYKLLELHTWMVLHRLRQEGNDGLVAGMAFVDAMWRDIEPRLKIAGAQMSQKTDGLYYLNNHFNSAVVAYDEALLVNDDKAMAHALWLNVFDGRDCDPRNLELLLAYTRKQMQHLHKIESILFLSGQKIEFLPIEFDDGDKQIKRRPKKEYHIPRPTKSTSIID